jgi:antitoxin (DNA-binding transcriptional repressor) of toxin-antitoxin stability system
MKVNMHEAKSQLSKLGEKAWQGEEIIIAKAGTPYLDLVPHRGIGKPRRPGRFSGGIELSEDFNDESSEINAIFSGE